MPFPTSLTSLGRTLQSTDGNVTEAYTVPSVATGYHLGAGLTPPQPASWINTPDGAFPVNAPGVLGPGVGPGFTNGQLTASSAYAWALTNVTSYGETTAGPQLAIASIGANTGYNLALPPVNESTVDNPVIRRRLYRTAAAGTQLRYVAELPDLALTTYRDGLPDTELLDNVPTTNTSGATGIVSLSGGGVATWTERTPLLAQTSMAGGDFVVNRQTGNIVHAAADYGRAVQVIWTGETQVTSGLMNSMINALRDTAAAVGNANGLAGLDASTRVVSNNGLIAGAITASGQAQFTKSGAAFVDPQSGVTNALKFAGGLSGDNAFLTGMLSAVGGLSVPGKSVVRQLTHIIVGANMAGQGTNAPSFAPVGWDAPMTSLNASLGPGLSFGGPNHITNSSYAGYNNLFVTMTTSPGGQIVVFIFGAVQNFTTNDVFAGIGISIDGGVVNPMWFTGGTPGGSTNTPLIKAGGTAPLFGGTLLTNPLNGSVFDPLPPGSHNLLLMMNVGAPTSTLNAVGVTPQVDAQKTRCMLVLIELG